MTIIKIIERLIYTKMTPNWKWRGHQGSHHFYEWSSLITPWNSKVFNILFFLNSSVLAVSVPLFVRINHESGQTICGLAWNPKGNKELAYSDNQVSFYLNQSSSLSRHNLIIRRLELCYCMFMEVLTSSVHSYQAFDHLRVTNINFLLTNFSIL